jgi:hypothetical protein
LGGFVAGGCEAKEVKEVKEIKESDPGAAHSCVSFSREKRKR